MHAVKWQVGEDPLVEGASRAPRRSLVRSFGGAGQEASWSTCRLSWVRKDCRFLQASGGEEGGSLKHMRRHRSVKEKGAAGEFFGAYSCWVQKVFVGG